MNHYKFLFIISFIFLTGCMGKQANFSGSLQDAFGFSIRMVPSSESKCITLTKSIVVPSSLMTTCTLPAGPYIAHMKNSDGYFYYAPHPIKPANWLLSQYIQGVYLDNDMKSGNVFMRNISTPLYVNSPIRGLALPRTIFKYIKKSC